MDTLRYFLPLTWTEANRLEVKGTELKPTVVHQSFNDYTFKRRLLRLFEVTLCGWWDAEIQQLTNADHLDQSRFETITD